MPLLSSPAKAAAARDYAVDIISISSYSSTVSSQGGGDNYFSSDGQQVKVYNNCTIKRSPEWLATSNMVGGPDALNQDHVWDLASKYNKLQ